MQFISDLQPYKKIDEAFTNRIKINKLPQLYRADMKFAKSLGNEQMNFLLEQFNITGKYKYISIDSRSHMLMKGMFPCIPGWHCDDFYRPRGNDTQPDLVNVNEAAPAIHHILVLGANSRTEFLCSHTNLPSPAELEAQYGSERPVYYHYDRMLDERLENTKFVDPGTIYTFGPTAMHRGQAATENGWRYFIRITESNHREPKNEIRYQTQVYTNGRVSW